jgi:Kef-type K+ transport system membrane component KefB/voltage-gated potassium channel Kch
MPSLLEDITICVAAAWLLGLLAQLIRQPPLLAYLLGGFLVGPAALGLIHHPHNVEMIAELGLIFLLFMIGLEIDLKKVVSAGRSITVTAGVQIGGGLLLGLGVAAAVGLPLGRDNHWDGVYLAVVTASSCTVVIVKLLYDLRELDTLAGRITLGVLVVQDVFSILFLAIQPHLNDLKPIVLLFSLLRVAALVAIAMATARYVLPVIFRRVARLPELMLVGALAWCFLVGELAERLGLSRTMGALVAGVALSTFPYALDVSVKVTSLRDFFVTLFFVSLGLAIPRPDLQIVLWAAAIALFTVVSRVLTTFTPLYLLRNGLRISLLPSIHLAQISEFALVILALGLQAGHLEPRLSAAVSLAFVGLAVLSSQAITYSDPLVRRLMPLLQRAGLKDLGAADSTAPAEGAAGHAGRILFIGFFREASSLLEELTRRAPNLLPRVTVVDFNPVVFEALRQRGVHVVYGDVSHPETLAKAGAEEAAQFICTVPDTLLKGVTTEKLVRHLREINPHAQILVTTDLLDKVAVLRRAGADYVSLPRLDTARDMLEAIRAASDGHLERQRARREDELRGRHEILG